MPVKAEAEEVSGSDLSEVEGITGALSERA